MTALPQVTNKKKRGLENIQAVRDRRTSTRGTSEEQNGRVAEIKKGEDRKTRRGSGSDWRGGHFYARPFFFFSFACVSLRLARGEAPTEGAEERRSLTGLIPNSAVANRSDSN